MKQFFGFLFVIIGIICFPSVIAPGLTETLGRLFGWALTSVIPAYFLLRNSNKKSAVDEKQE